MLKPFFRSFNLIRNEHSFALMGTHRHQGFCVCCEFAFARDCFVNLVVSSPVSGLSRETRRIPLNERIAQYEALKQ